MSGFDAFMFGMRELISSAGVALAQRAKLQFLGSAMADDSTNSWTKVVPGGGIGTQAMADANQTPAVTVYCFGTIKCTGTLTGTRTLTLPTLTDALAQRWMIQNDCTGGSVQVKCAAGTTVTIATAKAAMIRVEAAGVKRESADVTA